MFIKLIKIFQKVLEEIEDKVSGEITQIFPVLYKTELPLGKT